MKKYFFFLVFTLLYGSVFSQAAVRILFDATKAEMAGNADWVVDADTHNIGFSSGPAVVGQGNESNPQTIPTPAQSGINASTPETYWNGSLSAWGVDCANHSYVVETLPYNGAISYGNSSNAQDLSNYKVFIVCEPNIVFSSSEKTALLNFVQNGGGLFIISDHTVSDRNNDGWDSPGIWNDLFTNNSVQNDPFGFSVDLQNFSQITTNAATLPGDSILHGPMGNVTEAQWSNGTTFTINNSDNATTKGVIYKTSSSTTGTTNVMALYGRFGNGKFAAIGDSSPCDDGTGDVNDVLYNGYFSDAAGNHQLLIMNMTIWLAETNPVSTGLTQFNPDSYQNENSGFEIYPNPSDGKFFIHRNTNGETTIVIYNSLGEQIKNISVDTSVIEIDLRGEEAGIYFAEIWANGRVYRGKMVRE
ncbi:MAG: T9SS type A sorting domain-containing protein [Bacteroidetes bacterium]|nr:T9SS type A sorting domain-containing protein [Bacteroidota bacterium]